jgi:endonuclease/exonuclease/phosphatase family metal-dependent hydrolase
VSPLPLGASIFAVRGPTLRRISLTLLCLIALIAALSGVPGNQAYAAKKPPSRVQLVSFIGASTSSLTVSWPQAKRVKSYEFELATNYDMVGRTTRKIPATSGSRMTYVLSGLTPGRTYCVQIRGKRGKYYGKRSRRTCKPTIVAQGTPSGTPYRVMTYNVCASACENRAGAASWSTRRGLATSLIQSQAPDVLALQEHPHSAKAPLLTQTLSTDYAATTYISAKDLLYRRDRFTLARTGSIELSAGKYAVWAELNDLAADNARVIFVSVHLTSGKDSKFDLQRETETERLIASIERENPDGVPVIYAGDFNSNKSRPLDAPAKVFKGAGHYDSYDLATRLSRPNWNSAADFSSAPEKPRKSFKWGDHVDRVFVPAGSTFVSNWASPAVMAGAKYDGPMPSDHKPVVVNIWLNGAS